MKRLMPWICLAAAFGANTAVAKTGVDEYRQGNYIKASEALNQSDSSSATEEYFKGRMRLYGYGELKNNELALKHLRNAAEKGHLDAQNILARYELLIEDDPEGALYWFRKAADNDDLKAQMYTAAAYKFGYGTKKNASISRRYYIAAAKNDNPIAQQTLVEYFLDSRSRHNRKLGMIWLDKAVALGNPKSQLLLGELYAQGKYVKKDTDKALSLFEKAYEQGSIPAMYQIGMLAFEKKEYEKAKTWFLKAAQKGYSPAQFELAKLYLKKDGASNQPHTGFLWMLKAAQNNNSQAQKQLANMYKEGIGVAKDENLSKEWLEKSKKKNSDREFSKKTEVVKWLSNDKGDDFTSSGYILEGILSPWNNQDALQENRYNQSPQLWTVTRDQLYKPNFVYTSPDEVTLDEYYHAIASTFNTLKSSQINLPIYRSNHTKNIQKEPVKLSDSPSLAVMQQAQSLLPFPVIGSQMNSLNFLNKKNEKKLSKLELLKAQAALGNPQAQFDLGQMYEQGIGVFQDSDKALEYYKMAADQYDLRAEYQMGMMYLYGIGVEKDFDRAEQWLKDAAFKGDAKAQFALARLKENGYQKNDDKEAIKQDIDESIALYYVSAANGYGPAQYRLAEILIRDNLKDRSLGAIKQRNNIIKKLYQGALSQGIQEAALPLAYFDAVSDNPVQQKKAFQVAKNAAQKGSPQGALLTGLMLDRGLGVDKDKKEAIGWYKQTVSTPVGAFVLGTYLVQGQNINQDIRTGQKLLDLSAQSGFPYGNLNLAILKRQQNQPFIEQLDQARLKGNSKAGLLLADYYLSLGNNDGHLQQARDIYKTFAEKGDRYAQLKMAYMYDSGLGGKTDYKAAQSWYEKSAEQNLPEAQYLLARLHFMGKLEDNPDYAKAKHLLKTAAPKYSPASVALGFIYETVDDNYNQARTAYRLASTQNNPIGQFNLGLMYEMGKGTKVNKSFSKKLYEKAAKVGHAQAITQLAGFAFYGVNGKRDNDYALKQYMKAAEQNDFEALYQLGLMSETGVATKRNVPVAIKYYQKAADLGNTKAQMALARIYQYGQGVPVDTKKAVVLYEKLAKENNPYAQFQLATLYYEGGPDIEAQPKKGKKLLLKSQKNGYHQASRVLQWLEAQSKDRISYIEPFMLLKQNDVAVQSSAELMFMDAINQWNRGDDELSRFILDKLLINYPHYRPAKRAYEQLDQLYLPKKIS